MKFRLNELQWLFNAHINGGVHNTVTPIRQWLPEANALYDAAAQSGLLFPELPMLEIGRFLGGGTLIIHAAAGNRRLVSVDNRDFDEIKQHLIKKTGQFIDIQQKCINEAKKLENVTYLVQDSKKQVALGNPYGFLMVDGDHSFQGVLADTLTHWSSVTDGGIVVYHDADPAHEGVFAVVNWLMDNGYAERISQSMKLLVLKKLKELDPDARPTL